jgi:hypothetical protein
MQQLEQVHNAPRLAFLVRRFHRAVERQHQKDAETIASLVRVLRNPRGIARTNADAFREIIREIAKEERLSNA